ncbi:MAG: hypothetical protein ACLTCQ_02955 [Enterocloster bolteae]
MAEVLCIPKTIPERTGYQIRSIRVCAYCRVSTDDDGQYHSYDAQMEYYKRTYPEKSGLGILRDICGRGHKRNQPMGEGGLPTDAGGM